MDSGAVRDKLDRIDKNVTQIHAALFGVEGEGGLYRQVQEHEKDLQDLKQSKAQAYGIIAFAGGIVSLLGTKLWALLSPGGK